MTTTTTTLRETAAQCRREVHIGAAILPRPLFVADFDDYEEEDDGDDDAAVAAVRPPRIGCATVSTVDEPDEVVEGRRNAMTNTTTTAITNTATTTTRYSRVLSSEFNSVVIEHHLKWSPLVHALPGPVSERSPPETTLGRYDFRHVDSMVDWAISRDLRVKGHVLVWHVTSPPFLEDMSPPEVRAAVRRHIFATMGYFRDRIGMWDVVNEALASDGTLVENVFYRKMGPGYVAECFRWAHEADPGAFLIYNDNKVEGCGSSSSGGLLDDGGNGGGAGTAQPPSPPGGGDDDDDDDGGRGGCCKATSPNQAKSDGFYRLLKSLVDDGVPIHGAGMQAHLDASGTGRNRVPTPSMVKRQIRRIGNLGLKVNISEMDVRVSRLELSGEGAGVVDRFRHRRDAVQAEVYRDVLSAALSEPSFHGAWLWGFTDRHTWVKNFYHDDTPLIFDDKYEKKAAYDGVQDALRSICSSSPNDDDDGGSSMTTTTITPPWYLESDYDEAGNEWGSDWMTPEEPDPAPEVAGAEGEGEGCGGRTEKNGGRDTTKEGQPDWLQPS